MEAIEGGAPAAGKAFATSLAFELLDTVAAAIADEGVKGGIRVAPIVAQGLGQACPAVQTCLCLPRRLLHVGQGSTPGL